MATKMKPPSAKPLPKKSPPAGPQSSRWQRFTLLFLVFSGGVAVMGMEMTASQLIAPYFGSTISVWTSLIGLVMVFLTTGYYLGGALADRRPSRELLGAIVLLAGLVMMIIPLFSKPVLMMTWQLTPKVGLLVGSLVGTFILFSIPNILLGCICPFAMKLTIADLGRTGRASGNIYAISAIGSVIGTFLPALVTISVYGVRKSIMIFGALLIVAALLLISRMRFSPAAGAMLLLAVQLPPLLPVKGLLVEKESPYNCLEVVQMGEFRVLWTDWSVFSYYIPGQFRTMESPDYLLLAPLMRPQPPSQWLRRELLIGLCAGTTVKQTNSAFGPIEIDGVEIDPVTVKLGRTYFDMNDPNLRVHLTDGRAFLASATEPYDWAVIDAYQGSDIPAHLVTKEFFELLKAHMSPNGVLSVNIAWWDRTDTEITRRVMTTIAAVFPKVYVITDIGYYKANAVILAGGDDLSPDNISRNAALTGHPGLIDIAAEMTDTRPPQFEHLEKLGEPLTDDQGSLRNTVDRMYLRMRRQVFEREREMLQ